MTFALIIVDGADFYININNITMIEMSSDGIFMRLYLAHGKFKVTPWIRATPDDLMNPGPGVTMRYIDYREFQLKFGESPE